MPTEVEGYDFNDALSRLDDISHWLNDQGFTNVDRVRVYGQNNRRMIEVQARGGMEALEATDTWIWQRLSQPIIRAGSTQPSNWRRRSRGRPGNSRENRGNPEARTLFGVRKQRWWINEGHSIETYLS